MGECTFDREDGGQLLVVDVDQARRFLGRVLGFGRDDRDRLAKVLDFAHREHRTIVELWPEPWSRGRDVICAERGNDARHRQGFRRIDCDDPCVRDRQRHELAVQLTRQVNVGDVFLGSSYTVLAPNATDWLADHWSTTCGGISRTLDDVTSCSPASARPWATVWIASTIW